MDKEFMICASRGRSPDNPSDRRAGIDLEQRLEPQSEGICNALTSLTKDNYVMEIEIERLGQISSDGSQYGTVVGDGGVSPTLSAGTHGYANNCIQHKYRIRKLTPKECFRLMNFDDEDYYAAESVNSDTQLFKQAGNSIVCSCLTAIFSQLNIKGINPWNNRSEDDLRHLTESQRCINPNFERNPI